MDFSDIPLRLNGDEVDVSWWNSLRQAGIDLAVTSSAAIADNQSSPASVTGLLFDSGTIKTVFIDYWVKRIASSTVMEVGRIAAWYDGSTWNIGKAWYQGNAEIEFTITGLGQIQYTTDDMSGSYDTVNSKMKWRLATLGA